jgi:phosphoribosylamine--glycine ligase
MAAKGYPTQPVTGDAINGLAEAKAISGVEVFHAGTSKLENGEYVTAGGRVLGVTALGQDLPGALELAYSAVQKITWNGMQYRRDIGSTTS